MVHRPQRVPRSRSAAPVIWAAAGVALLSAFLFLHHFEYSKRREEKREALKLASARFQSTEERFKRLLESRSFKEAESLLEEFNRAFPALAQEPRFLKQLEARRNKIESARAQAFKEDWEKLKTAYKSRNFSEARRLALLIKNYGTAQQRALAEQTLDKIAKAEERAQAEAEFEAASKQARLLCKEGRFQEARGALRALLARRPQLAASAVWTAKFNSVLKEIEKAQKAQAEADLNRLREAVRAEALNTAQSLFDRLSAYGSEEQIRIAAGLLAEARSARKPAEPERSESASQALSASKPHKSTEQAPGLPQQAPRKESKARPPKIRRLDPAELPPISRTEAARLLQKLESAWRKPFGLSEGGVTGTVSLIPDALKYRLVEEALKKLETGAASTETLKHLIKYTRIHGAELRGKPIITVQFTCPSSYGIFFPKADLRRYFVVTYNDKKVARLILSKSVKPKWETWTLYVRDRHRIPRYAVVVWLLQGPLRLTLLLQRPWKRERLSFKLTGVWGLKKFRPGYTDWPGWNPERRILQRYKRISIEISSSPVVFYPDERAGKSVRLPPALEEIWRLGLK